MILYHLVSFFIGAPWFVKKQPEGNMMIRVSKIIWVSRILIKNLLKIIAALTYFRPMFHWLINQVAGFY